MAAVPLPRVRLAQTGNRLTTSIADGISIRISPPERSLESAAVDAGRACGRQIVGDEAELFRLGAGVDSGLDEDRGHYSGAGRGGRRARVPEDVGGQGGGRNQTGKINLRYLTNWPISLLQFGYDNRFRLRLAI